MAAGRSRYQPYSRSLSLCGYAHDPGGRRRRGDRTGLKDLRLRCAQRTDIERNVAVLDVEELEVLEDRAVARPHLNIERHLGVRLVAQQQDHLARDVDGGAGDEEAAPRGGGEGSIGTDSAAGEEGGRAGERGFGRRMVVGKDSAIIVDDRG